MEQLKKEVKWFVKNCGTLARPFMRNYLNSTIQACLRTHTQEEVDNAIAEATLDAEAELDQFLC